MKELKSISMSFRVSPRFKACLNAAAAHERRSQANFLEQLVFDYCEQHGLNPEAPQKPKAQKQVAQ